MYQLYQNVKSCVEMNGNKCDYFCCNIGVRQGDGLYQLLFVIFVNDLESYLLQLTVFRWGCKTGKYVKALDINVCGRYSDIG